MCTKRAYGKCKEEEEKKIQTNSKKKDQTSHFHSQNDCWFSCANITFIDSLRELANSKWFVCCLIAHL